MLNVSDSCNYVAIGVITIKILNTTSKQIMPSTISFIDWSTVVDFLY